MSVLCLIDDKYVPIYRIMWVSALPHFCGSPQCRHEGDYEVRLDQGEAVWVNQLDRDKIIEALEAWQGGLGRAGEADDEEDNEEM